MSIAHRILASHAQHSHDGRGEHGQERKDQPEVMQKIWAAKKRVARPVRQGA